ncbi:MAG: HlyC/CorC family transporter [Arenicellales bacterium]
MNDTDLLPLFLTLAGLVLLSGFFSASETAMMALNRYRLDNLAEKGHRRARVTLRLLQHPDRLLSTILLGNTVANLTAVSVGSVIALRLYGEDAIAAAGFVLTVVVLVFSEVAPKTLAASHPEQVSFAAAYPLFVMEKLLYDWIPVIHLINVLGRAVLRPFGIVPRRVSTSLDTDELRIAVRDSEGHLSPQHQNMLLRILELESMTVDDVMLPRTDIEAIDLDDDWDEIVAQLATSHHTRLPVYRGSMDHVVGVLHLRKVLHLSQTNNFNRESLEKMIRPPYFIPEGSNLMQQLLNLQGQRRRFGLVVDEYGDLKGLVTVEEILEEIVGEFTDNSPVLERPTDRLADGSYVVKGNANIRELNRKFGWDLPTDGPKTLNGLILEHMESIPEPGTSVLLNNYAVEIMQTRGTGVSVVKIQPRARPAEQSEAQEPRGESS